MATHSLNLDTLIRPVSTLLLEVHRLLQRSTDLPGSQQPEDAPLLLHHSPSPPLPTPTTESMEAQVTNKPKPDAKIDDDKTLVNTTPHLYTLTNIHITPKQSTNPLGNLNDTKPKDSPTPNT